MAFENWVGIDLGDVVHIDHPFSCMDLSDDLAQLEQGLREAGLSGSYLLRHFSGLVQHLTCSLEQDVHQIRTRNVKRWMHSEQLEQE